MKRAARMVGLFILLCITGCSSIGDYLSIAKDRGLSKEYLAALKEWTRTETVYSEFETRVTISATYRGQAFKNAYFREYDRLYSTTEADRARRDAVRKQGESESTEFFFYAYLPEKSHNDFGNPTSIWSVFLVTEKGERIMPREVRRIDKVTPLIEGFYPYVHKYYGSCYHLTFPAGDGTPAKPFKLVFTGVLATATLEWE